ncbi:bifunctional DNA primase/polymerase [Kribbella sp. NBC_00889]|uniref:bifunctional DNA primase/polymerase n=1 Tax=Kribbella sp. NBC_00889 TaxID=2975974 RepID=UPI00386DABB2|nr:bifunctional DNA primase/polymerase [Kribbella sp. NBC_00889]
MNTTRTARRTRAVTDTDHQLLSRAAHWHADHGFAVFPLMPGRKVPAVEKNWEAAATTNHLAIARTWRQAPYNIGVAAGPSGLLVIDLDQPKTPTDLAPEPWCTQGATSGADVLALLTLARATDMPGTYTVTTPTGGQHLYYRQTDRGQLGNSAGRLGWRIDTRGHGGYIVGAGSTTPHGRYLATRLSPPQSLPNWIVEQLDTSTPYPQPPRSTAEMKNTAAYAAAALAGELEKVLAAPTGQRNDTLNRAAFALGQLTGAHLLAEAIATDELLTAAARIGLPHTEAERTITSGLTAGARHPRQQPA